MKRGNVKMSNELILQSGTKRLLHVGNRVKLFRECKDMDVKTFAERCGFTLDEACEIEAGRCRKLNTFMVLKMSEVLGIAYSDIFETDSGKYFSNFYDPDVVGYAFEKAKARKMKNKFIAETLNCTEAALSNFKYRRIIPHPFVLGNLFGLLGITATELKNNIAGDESREALRSTESVAVRNPATEETKEKTEPESMQMMNEILKAIELYRNVDSLIAQLDDIIEKAQEIKKALGGK